MGTEIFEDELLKLRPNLMKFAMSLISDRDNASDLVQETYLKALTYKGKYQVNTNLRAWTFTIMKNTFINGYRRESKFGVYVYNADDQQLINSRTSHLTPESDYSHNELSRKINELDPEFRIPFQMYMSGFKYKEIAEKLNLKLGTVKSRIFFSRKKLMEALKNQENEKSKKGSKASTNNEKEKDVK